MPSRFDVVPTTSKPTCRAPSATRFAQQAQPRPRARADDEVLVPVEVEVEARCGPTVVGVVDAERAGDVDETRRGASGVRAEVQEAHVAFAAAPRVAAPREADHGVPAGGVRVLGRDVREFEG